MRLPLLPLLCAVSFTSTFSIGAFPGLLPEIGGGLGLRDWQLGILAGSFGLARMAADVPLGLVIGRHIRRGLLLAPALLAAGALCLASGAGFGVVLLGRVVMGFAHALNMISGLTAVLRHQPGRTLAFSLNAMEFAAVLGIIGGATTISLLPTTLSWRAAYLLACAPLVIGLAGAPLLARGVPAEAPDQRPTVVTAARAADLGTARRPSRLVAAAFVAGALIAVAYSTVEQFLVPIRGTRELGLDRAGVARMLLALQVADVALLIPVGLLSDRLGVRPILALHLVVIGAAVVLVGLGSHPLALLGCALFGAGMAGWMLPLSVLRQETPPERIAWRTSLYRVGVDGGLFLGPVLGGALGLGRAPLLVGTLGALLVAIAVLVGRGGGGARRG